MRWLGFMNLVWNDFLTPVVAGVLLAIHLESITAGAALALTVMSLTGAIRGAGQDQTSRIERKSAR